MTESPQLGRGFLLTRQWRESKSGLELEFWVASEAGPQQIVVDQQRSVFFLRREDAKAASTVLSEYSAWTRQTGNLRAFDGDPVDAYYFRRYGQARQAADRLREAGLDPLEDDINPCDRYLMERSIRGELGFRGSASTQSRYPRWQADALRPESSNQSLRMLSLDIETAMEGVDLFSVGLYAVDQSGETRQKVLMRRAEGQAQVQSTAPDYLEFCADEKQLFLALLDCLQEWDPDVIIGWNVVNFDMWYLQAVADKYRLPLLLGRGNSAAQWREIDSDSNRRQLFAPGRVVLDGIDLLKAAFYRFERFSLNHVAGELLGDSKLLTGSDRGETIGELFIDDPGALAAYNLQDCKLVWDIFQHTDLLDFAMTRCRLTGLALDRLGGSVAAFDYRYLPLLHRQGYVAPNGHRQLSPSHSPGGFVLDSRPGIYDNVVILDFKSLYPSIIRSFCIDPLGLALGAREADQKATIEGFSGARFSRDQHLLPGIIADLWQAREKAKLESNSVLSHAIKIIMNSFYGVLGSFGCRFFDARLAHSITGRGQQLLQQSCEYIESRGWTVIYGDTDSVFVHLQGVPAERCAESGRALAAELNNWWKQRLKREYGVDSALEMEFETHFRRFLMPTVRGTDIGSKKRYAGIVDDGEGGQSLMFKGLEAVRSDWTALAREFQYALYERVFADRDYLDLIHQTVDALMSGKLDEKLVYRKRLRQRLDSYERNIPPHARAAMRAVEWTGADLHRGSTIEYIITTNGPEPVDGQRSGIDYQHYLERQLAPVADTILGFYELNFDDLVSGQSSLF